MTSEEKQGILAINDLAEARLRNPPLDPNVEHDLKEIARLSRGLLGQPKSGLVKIQINGGEFGVPETPLTYERVLKLIGVDPTRVLTVVYCADLSGDAKREGSLFPGASVDPCEGMIIQARNTSGA